MRHLPVLLLPLIVVFAIGCGGSGDSGKGAGSSGGKRFAQKVLDADPKLFTGPNVRSPKNLKDFTPKHTAGAKADAIQALTMLTPGSAPSRIKEGGSYTYAFGLRCNPALWNAVFGSPANVHQGRNNKQNWLIKCSDGDLVCVGDILGNQMIALDTVIEN